jgi:hypothetical protein
VRLRDRELEALVPVLVGALERNPGPDRWLVSLARRVLDLVDRRGYPKLVRRLEDAIRDAEATDAP